MSSVETALAKLDALQRDALLVLTLDCEYPLTRSRWQERVRDAGVVTADGRRIDGAAFDAVVGALVGSGALEESRGGYTTALRWMPAVVDDGQQRGRLG